MSRIGEFLSILAGGGAMGFAAVLVVQVFGSDCDITRPSVSGMILNAVRFGVPWGLVSATVCSPAGLAFPRMQEPNGAASSRSRPVVPILPAVNPAD